MKLVMKAAWGSRRLASSGVFRMFGLKWLSTSPIPFSWYSAEFQGSFRPHSSASMTSYCHSEPASSGSLAPRIGEGERCFGLRARNEGVLLRDPSNFASKQLVIKMVNCSKISFKNGSEGGRVTAWRCLVLSWTPLPVPSTFYAEVSCA